MSTELLEVSKQYDDSADLPDFGHLYIGGRPNEAVDPDHLLTQHNREATIFYDLTATDTGLAAKLRANKAVFTIPKAPTSTELAMRAARHRLRAAQLPLMDPGARQHSPIDAAPLIHSTDEAPTQKLPSVPDIDTPFHDALPLELDLERIPISHRRPSALKTALSGLGKIIKKCRIHKNHAPSKEYCPRHAKLGSFALTTTA